MTRKSDTFPEQAGKAVYSCTIQPEEYHREHLMTWRMQGNGLSYLFCRECGEIMAVEVDGNRVFTDIKLTQNVH